MHGAGRARVLEIGTGSGYQAAIRQLGRRVISIERHRELSESAAAAWPIAGYDIQLVVGDGTRAGPGGAVRRACLVTAAGPSVGAPSQQLSPDGGSW
jgi:protein-L-isoaspartate(D-aspartate) O-methyltransferase